MCIRYSKLLFVAILIVILVGCKSDETTSSAASENNDPKIVAGSELQQDGSELQQDGNAFELEINGDIGLGEDASNVVHDEQEIDSSFVEELSDTAVLVGNDMATNISANNVPIVVGENIVISEDQSITLSDLLANDSDQDADEINIVDFSRNSIKGGTLELVSVNVLKYTPAEHFNGSDSFAYVVSDGQGASATATVNITVEEINDMPQVSGEKIILPEDESILLMGLISNDFDEDGDELTIQDYSQGVEGGVVELLGENILKYTPQEHFYGADSFTYSVSDGKGVPIVATVDIEVREVNDIPKAQGEVVTIGEDESILLSSLLDNDSDVDADKLEIGSFGQSENGGMVELSSSNELRYVPAANFSGTDSFDYVVSDGRGGEAVATVTIFVAEVNDIPVAKVDSFLLTQGRAQEVDVLANDEGVSEDVKISFISLPQNGDLEVTSAGKVIYTPRDDYFGQDSFIYQVKDKDDETSVATASLEIECVEKCNTTFSIAWEPSVSENVEGYKVYYGTEASNLDQIVELGNITHYDHFVDIKGEYFFAVSAVNDINIESELTGIVSGVF